MCLNSLGKGYWSLSDGGGNDSSGEDGQSRDQSIGEREGEKKTVVMAHLAWGRGRIQLDISTEGG